MNKQFLLAISFLGLHASIAHGAALELRRMISHQPQHEDAIVAAEPAISLGAAASVGTACALAEKEFVMMYMRDGKKNCEKVTLTPDMKWKEVREALRVEYSRTREYALLEDILVHVEICFWVTKDRFEVNGTIIDSVRRSEVMLESEPKLFEQLCSKDITKALYLKKTIDEDTSCCFGCAEINYLLLRVFTNKRSDVGD